MPAKPKESADSETRRVRVNLWITPKMHKQLRIYAILNGDKPLVETIQDILGTQLEKIKTDTTS